MSSQLAKILGRIDEVMKSKRFASERAWCEAAGVSPSYIGALRSKAGTGDAKTAKVEQLRKLANSAGVTVDWLMGDDDERGAPLDDNDQREGSKAAIDQVIDRYPWPADLEPGDASEAVDRLRKDAFKTDVPLPESYWETRLRRLIAEVQGRAKDAPARAPSTTVDLTQESEEIRVARKRPKRL